MKIANIIISVCWLVLSQHPFTAAGNGFPTGPDPMRKAYVDNREGASVLVSVNRYQDGYRCLYFDRRDNIRKYVSFYDYPESTTYMDAEYDADGRLVSITFRSIQPEGDSFCGIMVFSSGKVKVDYKIRDDIYSQWRHISEERSDWPQNISDWDTAGFTGTAELKQWLGLGEAVIPPDAEEVVFLRPAPGDTVFINSNGVLLYDSSCKPVETGDAGERVVVKGVGERADKTWRLINLHGREYYVSDDALSAAENRLAEK